MSDLFKLTLAQLTPCVGDIPNNRAKALAAWESGKAARSDLVALPEMFLTGYQLQDLVLRPAFDADCRAALDGLAAGTRDGPAPHQ